MHRKILGLLTALVALGAFAAMPAIGSAATLTDTVGGVTQKPAAGALVIAEGTGTTVLTSSVTALNVECNENVMTGSVHRNSSGIIEATLTHAWFQGNYFAGDADTSCRNLLNQKVFIRTNLTTAPLTGETARTVTHKENTNDLRTHWCVVGNAENDNFVVNPRNCTGAGGAFRFSVHTGGLVCGFSRTEPIPGTFNTSNTHTNVAELTMAPDKQKFTTDNTIKEHSGFCPAEGFLDNFVFALYTDNDTTPTTGIHPVPVNKTQPLYISSP